MMNDISELRRIALAYSKLKTFVFVEELINFKKSYYNGIILKVYDNMILFYDEKLKKEFPILFESINLLKPSNKKEGENGMDFTI